MSKVQDETVSFSLEVNVEPAFVEVRKLQTLLYRTLSLMKRMGLPDDLSAGIHLMMLTIQWLNKMRLAMAAFYAASGPIGWAMFGLAAGEMAMMGSDLMYDYTRSP